MLFDNIYFIYIKKGDTIKSHQNCTVLQNMFYFYYLYNLGDDFEGHTTSTISEVGIGTNNLNLNGSKAYQDMQRETLMSPVQEDFDDNDSLDDLLGGGRKAQSPVYVYFETLFL